MIRSATTNFRELQQIQPQRAKTADKTDTHINAPTAYREAAKDGVDASTMLEDINGALNNEDQTMFTIGTRGDGSAQIAVSREELTALRDMLVSGEINGKNFGDNDFITLTAQRDGTVSVEATDRQGGDYANLSSEEKEQQFVDTMLGDSKDDQAIYEMGYEMLNYREDAFIAPSSNFRINVAADINGVKSKVFDTHAQETDGRRVGIREQNNIFDPTVRVALYSMGHSLDGPIHNNTEQFLETADAQIRTGKFHAESDGTNTLLQFGDGSTMHLREGNPGSIELFKDGELYMIDPSINPDQADAYQQIVDLLPEEALHHGKHDFELKKGNPSSDQTFNFHGQSVTWRGE